MERQIHSKHVKKMQKSYHLKFTAQQQELIIFAYFLKNATFSVDKNASQKDKRLMMQLQKDVFTFLP